MKVLLVESLTARAHFSPDIPLAPSLLREGRAMFDALRADLAAIEGLEVSTHLDLAEYTPDAVATAARSADAALVVAPETDGELYDLIAALERAGVRHFNSTSEGVRIASDKFALAGLLASVGLPHPRTELWDGRPPSRFPCVLKPRIGAGSQNTFRFDSPPVHLSLAEPTIVQDYIPGTPSSMSIVADAAGYICLRGAKQLLSDDGRFRWLGCELPLDGATEAAMRSTIARTMAIPSLRANLRGWVGFDMVLTDAGPVTIEINPRPTTSYLALRMLCESNPMLAMLGLSELTWKSGNARFEVG